VLANRSFADGTNAWTATDHTAYTLTTAGAEGFFIIVVDFIHIWFLY
jgi:Zn-dependent M16 (insulinase) family peptidase